jgi:DNA mismatch endonuclease (patch repair protein)
MDFLDRQARSALMARIRGRDTKPELAVRRYLHGRGLRYRLHDKSLPGKPDLVFGSRKVAVFVHGCFWHGHRGCKKARTPKTRPEFWAAKVAGNMRRDRRVARRLRGMGWRVFTVWQCCINDARMDKLYRDIVSGDCPADTSQQARQGSPKKG